ncbi:MAG: hypothetical protein IT210_23495 [Armatimonadetes bacterium]|nr:hypothetical protein [Armatimonadota bacterium]
MISRRFTLWGLALIVLLACAPVFAARPPSWAVGTFSGHSSLYDMEVELTIYGSGEAVVSNRNADGRLTTTSGSYRRGRLYLGKYAFDLDRTGRGIRTVQADDSRNRIDYRRTGRPGGLDDDDRDDGRYGQVPSWAVGTFSGYSDLYASRVELTIYQNGTVSSTNRAEDGKVTRASGNYADGRIALGKVGFYVSRSGSGIRITQVDDPRHRIDLRRGWIGGGYDRDDEGYTPSLADILSGRYGNREKPPSWAVGTWRGYSRLYNMDVVLTVSRNGAVSVGSKGDSASGSYRNNRIVADSKTFIVERTRGGLRLIQSDDSRNRVDFRKY